MNDFTEHEQIVFKCNDWIGLLKLVRVIAKAEVTGELTDEEISELIKQLINAGNRAFENDNTMAETTMRFEHRSGCEIHLRLELGLLKPIKGDES